MQAILKEADMDLRVGLEAIIIRIAPVVGWHVTCGKLDCYKIRLTGSKKLRLREAAKNYVSLLDTTVGIRSRVIKLNYVLTCYVTGIGNLYNYGNGIVCFKIKCIAGIRAYNLPVEGGVGKTVTEGIYYLRIIPAAPGCGSGAVNLVVAILIKAEEAIRLALTLVNLSKKTLK